MKRIFFFATPSDIVPVLRRFQSNAPLKYIQTCLLTKPDREIYLDPSEIPNAGTSTSSTGSCSKTYLVSLRDVKNQMHTSTNVLGQRQWMLNNGDNEDTVLLTLAGFWTTGTLLPGVMDTMHDTRSAQQLMRWFLASLQQENFVKLDMWWLGSEAMALLKAGRRLTSAEQAPPECDLRLPCF